MVGPPLDQGLERRGRLWFRIASGDQRLDARQIVRRAPAPLERELVAVDRHAVELDRPLDCGVGDREEPPLPGDAEHEGVGGDRVAEQIAREPLRVEDERVIPEA